MGSPKIQRALISVSDKLGLADFARGLVAAGVEIFSTGGTRRHLENEGVPVRDISAYTGFPEMMDGRLKTLHPKVFGGILCRHDNPSDMESLAEHAIETFELVVVNLYPFEATVAREGVTTEEAIEQIDIGGPSLVRAAAKNHAYVTIATNPEQYSAILDQVAAGGTTTESLRSELAGAAFTMTARYDHAIACYFAEMKSPGDFPATLNLNLKRKTVLRYGENPHQEAALYLSCASHGTPAANLVTARQLHGKELSYNNLLDLDSALAIARSLPDAAAVVVKHNNPCGAASSVDGMASATQRAFEGDPVSAFGCVVGFNQTVDAATAEVLVEPGRFVEAIVAPDFEPGAIDVLTTRPKWKDNVRLVKVGPLSADRDRFEARHIEGGLLMQEIDAADDPQGEWRNVTDNKIDDKLLDELRFAWSICRYVKSNAIVLAKDRALVGVGAGQMSRVDSVDIAIKKAGERVAGAVLASDAFFPFEDSIDRAAEAGVCAVIQPGGSRRDNEVIAACNRHGLPMIFTGRRHFRH